MADAVDDTPRQDVYIYVHPGEIERSQEPADGVIVDYATDGSVVGVEVLDVQRVTINNRAASAAPETSPDAAANIPRGCLNHEQRWAVRNRVEQLVGWAKSGVSGRYYLMDQENVDRLRFDVIEAVDAALAARAATPAETTEH